MSASTITPERLHKRLVKLFCKVFPALNAEEAPVASMETVKEWDSLATLTLFTLAEQEFGIKLGFDRIPQVKSFEALAGLIQRRLG